MFELLQEEFTMGIYDANGIQDYVTLGVIDQSQADQITGKAEPSATKPSQDPQAAQSATPQPTQSNSANA